MTQMKKTIKAVIVRGMMYFKCPYCGYEIGYPLVHYEAFDKYGYDCNKCYTRFKVIFTKHNMVIN